MIVFERHRGDLVAQARDQFVVYYAATTRSHEPGRYIAIARVAHMFALTGHPGFLAAHVSEYEAFPRPVPYVLNGGFFESALLEYNWRSFSQRLVRTLPTAEFRAILDVADSHQFPAQGGFGESNQPAIIGTPYPTETVKRARRDIVLRHQALEAYNYRCALTRRGQVSPFGSHESECCHLAPVKDYGVSTLQNVMLIARTFHWLVDHFLISFEDDFRIIVSPLVDPSYAKSLNRSGFARVPHDPALRPSLAAIRYYRAKFGEVYRRSSPRSERARISEPSRQ